MKNYRSALSTAVRDAHLSSAAVTAIDLVTYGRERARIGPWNGDARVGLVAPQPGGPPASAALVRRCVERLAGAGFQRAVTAALGPEEQHGFLAAGFTVNERLHLLRHDLATLPARTTPTGYELRRATSRDREASLAIDHNSFGDFWRLDMPGLDDARTATPHSRFRVAQPAGRSQPVAGYAVTGRHARRGYIQRLAVDPFHRHNGVGSALVGDALHWLRRWRSTAVFVNTQESNTTALALYEHLGFERQTEGLTVLTAAVGG